MNTKAYELARTMADECLAGKARRLSRVITSIYDRALQPYGIKVNQASILVFLSAAGDATPGDMGKRLQMEKSTVSRNIDRMKKNGWLEVVERGAGGTQIIRITALGRQLLVDSHDQWQNAQRKAMELLSEDGADALRLLAERLRHMR